MQFFSFFAARNHFKKMKSILENYTLYYNSIHIKNTKKNLQTKIVSFYENYRCRKHLLIVYTIFKKINNCF